MDKYLYLVFCVNKPGWVPYHKKLIGVFSTEDGVRDAVIEAEDNHPMTPGSCLVIEQWTVNKREEEVIEYQLKR